MSQYNLRFSNVSMHDVYIEIFAIEWPIEVVIFPGIDLLFQGQIFKMLFLVNGES